MDLLENDENISIVYKRCRMCNELEKNDDFEINDVIPVGKFNDTVESLKPARDYYAHSSLISLPSLYDDLLIGPFRFYTPLRLHNFTYLFRRFPGDEIDYNYDFTGYNANVPLAIKTIKGAVRLYCERRLHRIRMDQFSATFARIAFQKVFGFSNPFM